MKPNPIEVNHRGYTIELQQHDGQWKCAALNLANESLRLLKKRIDAIQKSERRVNVKALLLETGDWRGRPTFRPVTVTVLCEPETYSTVATECWVVQGSSRSKERIDQLFRTRDVKLAKKWLAEEQMLKLAEKKVREALDAIPRHTVASLIKEGAD